MNDNWHAHLREIAILLGDMPPPVLLRQDTAPHFGQLAAHLPPFALLDREQTVSRMRLPGIDRDRS
jgi:hypothetical protein